MKSMLVDLEALTPLRVRQSSPGTYQVHAAGQEPIEGTAVYRYSSGIWTCEVHGSTNGTTRAACRHVQLAQRHMKGAPA